MSDFFRAMNGAFFRGTVTVIRPVQIDTYMYYVISYIYTYIYIYLSIYIYIYVTGISNDS